MMNSQRMQNLLSRMDWYFPDASQSDLKNTLANSSKNCFGIRPVNALNEPKKIWELILHNKSTQEYKITEIIQKGTKELVIEETGEHYPSLLNLISVSPLLKNYKPPKFNVSLDSLSYSRKYSGSPKPSLEVIPEDQLAPSGIYSNSQISWKGSQISLTSTARKLEWNRPSVLDIFTKETELGEQLEIVEVFEEQEDYLSSDDSFVKANNNNNNNNVVNHPLNSKLQKKDLNEKKKKKMDSRIDESLESYSKLAVEFGQERKQIEEEKKSKAQQFSQDLKILDKKEEDNKEKENKKEDKKKEENKKETNKEEENKKEDKKKEESKKEDQKEKIDKKEKKEKKHRRHHSGNSSSQLEDKKQKKQHKHHHSEDSSSQSDNKSTLKEKKEKKFEKKEDKKPLESPEDKKPLESPKDKRLLESPKDKRLLENPKDKKPLESPKDKKPLESPKEKKEDPSSPKKSQFEKRRLEDIKKSKTMVNSASNKKTPRIRTKTTSIFNFNQSKNKDNKPPELDRKATLDKYKRKIMITFDFRGPYSKRNYAIQEFIQTEKEFCQDLNHIVGLLCKPISKILTRETFQGLFSNIVDILKYSNKTITNLSNLALGENLESKEILPIGQIFLKKLEKDLDIYIDSCSTHTLALWIHYHLLLKEKRYKDCIVQALLNPNFRKLPFDSLIIKPLQRITKYPLLFSSIREETPNDTEESKALDFLIDRTKNLLIKINSLIESHKQVVNVVSILSTAGLHQHLYSTKSFAKEGIILKLNKNKASNVRLVLSPSFLIMIVPDQKTKEMTVLDYALPVDEILLEKSETLKLKKYHSFCVFHVTRKKRFVFVDEDEKNIKSWVSILEDLYF